MADKQKQAPILDAIKAVLKAGMTAFAIPGHKMGKGIAAETAATIGREAFRYDQLEAQGFDDTKVSGGFLEKAQQLAAEAYGADQTFFSTNGSTLSAHVAAMVAAGPGEKVLVQRNSHKSIIAGLILSGAHPVFIRPQMDEELEIAHGLLVQDVARALKKHPDARALIALNPTYYGVSPNVSELVKVCHAHEIPILVDEAWGSHFPFHPDLPHSAMACGADLSFASLHKTETALAQSSIINIKGQRIDPARVQALLDLEKSTSESGLLLASIDACRRQMATQGRDLVARALELSDHARKAIGQIDGLKLMGPEVLDKPGAHKLDRTKLVIDVQALGISGYFAASWLRSERHLTVELFDHRRIMPVVTIADDSDTIRQLLRALHDLSAMARKEKPDTLAYIPPARELEADLVISPRDAFFGQMETLPLEKAIGRVCAEIISPYPPGIPILAPGERLTWPIAEYLKTGLAAGMYVPDASDPSLKTIRVVK